MSLFRSMRARRSERRLALPGDDLVAVSIGSLTHAVTTRRSRREVLFWLVQMGAGRRDTDGFTVLRVEPDRHPILGWISAEATARHRAARRESPPTAIAFAALQGIFAAGHLPGVSGAHPAGGRRRGGGGG